MKTHPMRLLIGALLAALLMACSPAAAPTSAPTAPAAATRAATTAPTVAPTVAPTLAPTVAPTVAPTATSAAYPLTLTDSAGRKVTLAKAPQKIVSLAPSTTEMVYVLGQQSKLVAVDDFSDYPAEAKNLPKVGSMKLNYEQIVALNPDLIFAAGITAPDALKKLEELKLTVLVVGAPTTSIESVIGDITLVGNALQAAPQARQVTDAMQKKMDGLKAKAANAKSKPKVYWELDATDPSKPFSVGPGSFINDIITLSAGENIFAKASGPYPQVNSEGIVAANPDVIILSDAAYGVTVEQVKARKGWEAITAVKTNKVFPIDDSLVSRPGPRLVDGVEAALKLIHPELFQ